MRSEPPVAPDAPRFRPSALGGDVEEINDHAPFGDNGEMLRLHLQALLDSLRSPGLDRAPTDTATDGEEEHGR